MDLIVPPPSEITEELNPATPESQQSQENSDTTLKLSGSSDPEKSGGSGAAATMPDSQDSVTTDDTKISNDSNVLDTETTTSVENVNSAAEDNTRTIENSDKLKASEEQVNANELEDTLKCINSSISEICEEEVREPESLTDTGSATDVAATATDSPVPTSVQLNETEATKSPAITTDDAADEKKDEEEQPMELDEEKTPPPEEPEKMDIDESSVEKATDQVDVPNEEENKNDDNNKKKESSAPIIQDADQEEPAKEQKTTETSTDDLPDAEQQTNDALSETEDQDMQQENPVFVHVNTKDGEGDNDKTANFDVDQSETGDESLEATCLNEEDPIGITQEGDKDVLMDFSEDTNEKEPLKVVDFNDVSAKSPIDDDLNASKGADEELCIIPDTEREISQEEKDAARAAAAAAVEKTTSEVKTTENETTAAAKVVEDTTDKPETTPDAATPSAEAADPKVTTTAEKSAETGEVTTPSDTELLNSGLPESNHEASSGEPAVARPDDIKVKNIPEGEQTEQSCQQCCTRRKAIYEIEEQEKPTYLCSETCLISFRTLNKPAPEAAKSKAPPAKDAEKSTPESTPSAETSKAFVRKCSECNSPITTGDEKVLSWETMDFCYEDCLSKYQNTIGSHCANCKEEVLMSSLGKYCVRFGHDIRQFCCSNCLEEFKKGLKVCSYCQKDISGGQEGFLAPVGDKGQFKDFCTQLCMDKYEQMSNKNSVKKSPPESALCSVCAQDKSVNVLFEQFDAKHKFCGEPCFIAYKYVNNVDPLHCEMCKNYFENANTSQFSIYYDNLVKNFCSKTCQNIYIIANRRIVPCSWCKVKKYNFDMIRKVCSNGQVLMMCSLNCLSLFQVSISAVSTKRMKCDHCSKISQAQYHLTMSDATIRNFCAYPCVMAFQNQFSKLPITLNSPVSASTGGVEGPKATIATRSAVPAGGPKRYQNRTRTVATDGTTGEVQLPVITSVQSLASSATNGPTSAPLTRGAHKINNQQPTAAQPIPVSIPQYKQQVIVKAPPLPPMRNAATSCKPIMHTKGVSCRPHPCSKETQTEEVREKTVLIPVPVPIYIPAPAHMYSAPVPVPIPFPIPIPVPIFIPTTRNSAAGIMKEIKKIQVKIPTDPFEAELLMMAEMVAGEKKVENTDSESEDDDPADTGNDGGFSPEAVDTSNTFGDDMLQMALKMATELDEPAVDLEGALTANTITASQTQDQTGVVPTEEAVDDPQPMHPLMDRNQAMRGRKRPNRQPRNMNAAKRGRRMSQHVEMPLLPPPPPQQPPEPIEKPDANMCLKYTFGVNAWKQWVTTKNAELEKSSRRVKLFKNEILQLTADELNYSLCLFVKEVRKPNGTEYAPDTIYYLCLGIQQYLFENGRIDNIFTDAYYEKFTDCLDEVARKFSVLYNDSHYIVTRVEEEHLWESKQLGAHSPHVLLSTLMFFNTKHFNLTTVDEHMQLSFSHIMKHWKRNPNQPGAAKIPGSRNVLLRFYPPQTTLDSNSRKKKVYEQQENEENPLRCPVKLYEFYLSKCPESVKTRNDVFYLLPERSCVPDSPVWYSTMALGREALEKMLHRVKMVKEINVALLTS